MAYDRLPLKFMHPADRRAREGEIMQRKRDRWRDDACIPPDRVYQVIGETSGPEVGTVTRPSISVIVWNPVTKRWDKADHSQIASPAPATSVEKVARMVKNSGNPHKSGNF